MHRRAGLAKIVEHGFQWLEFDAREDAVEALRLGFNGRRRFDGGNGAAGLLIIIGLVANEDVVGRLTTHPLSSITLRKSMIHFFGFGYVIAVKEIALVSRKELVEQKNFK